MTNLCFRALFPVLVAFIVILSSLIPCIKGNTEIINFAALPAESPNMTFPAWMEMTPSNAEIALNIKPALDTTGVTIESGLWISLDLDNSGWSSYDKFTLRASWPASHPCDIHFKIYDPLHVASQLLRNRPLHSTRKKYAHVYAINTGVPTPSLTGEDMTWLRHEPIPLTLILEPLLFGVLPQSVLPVVLVMLMVIGVAFALLPYILRHYEHTLARVRRTTGTKQD